MSSSHHQWLPHPFARLPRDGNSNAFHLLTLLVQVVLETFHISPSGGHTTERVKPKLVAIETHPASYKRTVLYVALVTILEIYPTIVRKIEFVELGNDQFSPTIISILNKCLYARFPIIDVYNRGIERRQDTVAK